MTLNALWDVSAPAKINVFLHVVGRRADGHHLLQSLFVLLDWADTLHFERRSDGRLQRHDVSVALPADDLCLRAARALQAASGTGCGADISIVKQVPWGAGLGGGSSDAATTLLALNRLWGLNWSRSQLHALGLTLGADVPFFIGGNNAWVEGIGESLTPMAVPEQSFALIKPAVSIETRAVFSHPRLVRDTPRAILEGFDADELLRITAPADGVGWGHNDLQAVAELLHPEVRDAAAVLQSRYGNSRMSGSGSVVFARIVSEASVAPTLDDKLPQGWITKVCRSLSQHPLREWARDEEMQD
ncbi:MAG: 4-(cytidine 5'-diphospho)-2-C-methyl-D-erythritol kinase [Burkholderiales bacterium PBB1]|nr:MAG: 4-(cytidine 5'-diphospho)-2-C-methyl-D-erythritol kinase [Burkholderiales bacterium PBB1]